MAIQIELSSNSSNRQFFDKIVEAMDRIISEEWEKDKNVNFNMKTEITTVSKV